jgi:adenine-specific DNA-methyltransferase
MTKKRKTWTIHYLGSKAQEQIRNGVLKIVGRNESLGCVEVAYSNIQQRSLKTVWHRSLHDSGVYGSALLKAILGKNGAFSFPKSLYSTRDAIASVVRNRPDALIVDFFAGSGTTLNAVNLLNAADDGRRRCILVTNNEVSSEEAESLAAQGLQPGDAEWETQGICRMVTWPRSKYTIMGHRDDGTPLVGEYLIGRAIEKEIPRKFKQIGFIERRNIAALDDNSEKNNKEIVKFKRQLLSLIDSLPQNLVTDFCPFIVSDTHSASILFDTDAAIDWLEALTEQDHVTDFYILTSSQVTFDNLKAQVVELLGPRIIGEDEKRRLNVGFAVNLAYFKLEFLDKDRVALKRAFREILPLLWLKAGAVGARPELPADAAEPTVFAPESSNFAVLLDESRFAAFLESLADRVGLSHIFIITDADESFRAMAAEVLDALDSNNPNLQVVQLYRDYLTNFMINTERDSAARSVAEARK